VLGDERPTEIDRGDHGLARIDLKGRTAHLTYRLGTSSRSFRFLD
jgi:hypothetical protein